MKKRDWWQNKLSIIKCTFEYMQSKMLNKHMGRESTFTFRLYRAQVPPVHIRNHIHTMNTMRTYSLTYPSDYS